VTITDVFTAWRSELDEIEALAHPLQSARDLDPLVERVGHARFVLLGEASHGTADYYAWRAALTKRLIDEYGFDFVAVEGDWPDCFVVNQWVKDRADQALSARDVLARFDRWPTWMWANTEVADFVDWLRDFNRRRSADVGFYGLDVYSLWESLRVVLGYVRDQQPDALEAAMAATRCFEPYAEDPHEYAWSTRLVPRSCENEVVTLLGEIVSRARHFDGDAEASLDARQNAEILVGAERYYRAMVRSDESSWNLRDHHMVDTFDRLVDHYGPQSRGVVWEHNTHIGDARATDMARHGMVNVGQLVRESRGLGDVVAVGFAGHHGDVIASDAWGSAMLRLPVPAAPTGAHEHLIHHALGGPAIFVFPDFRETPWLSARRGHRAIGVVYNPSHEHGNWVPTVMGRRYDALVSFEETTALHPLHMHEAAAV
jgi:erythromycin esterase